MPEFLIVFLSCIVNPFFAVMGTFGVVFGTIAILEILTGVKVGSEESMLGIFSQEGAIFGPPRKDEGDE